MKKFAGFFSIFCFAAVFFIIQKGNVHARSNPSEWVAFDGRLVGTSPDETKILYVMGSYSPQVPQLYIMDADGQNQKRIDELATELIPMPVLKFSMDSKKVLYLSHENTLCVYNVASERKEKCLPEKLSPQEITGFDAAIGKDAVFTSEEKQICAYYFQKETLQCMPISDGIASEPATLTIESAIEVSQNGRNIAFLHDGDIYLANFKESKIIPVTTWKKEVRALEKKLKQKKLSDAEYEKAFGKKMSEAVIHFAWVDDARLALLKGEALDPLLAAVLSHGQAEEKPSLSSLTLFDLNTRKEKQIAMPDISISPQNPMVRAQHPEWAGVKGTTFFYLWDGQLATFNVLTGEKKVFPFPADMRAGDEENNLHASFVFLPKRNEFVYVDSYKNLKRVSLKTGAKPEILVESKLYKGQAKWQFEAMGGVSSSPAVGGDGTVYFGTWENSFFAVGADGKQKWEFKTENFVYGSPALGENSTVYFGSLDGNLYALNLNGTLKWKFKTKGEIYSSPAIASDGTIYIGSHDMHFYALDAEGTLKWKIKTEGAVASAPAIAADGTVYFSSGAPLGGLTLRYSPENDMPSPFYDKEGNPLVESYVYALHPDGSIKWKFKTDFIASSPALSADGTIYFGSCRIQEKDICSQGIFYALGTDGKVKWKFESKGDIQEAAAVAADGSVYFGSLDGNLYSVASDGKMRWTYAAGKWVSSAPAVGKNGTVYFGGCDSYVEEIVKCEQGALFAVTKDGKLKWKFETEEDVSSSPAIAEGGTIYFGDWGYLFHALKTDSLGLEPSSWARGRGDLENKGIVGTVGEK